MGIEYECASEVYMSDDIQSTGFLFEYCDRFANRVFGTEISRKVFVEKFMRSNTRYGMDIGFPRFFGQSAEDTFEYYVKDELDGDTSSLYNSSCVDDFCDLELLWIGQMYVYIHFKTKMKSSEIYDRMPLNMMRHFYVTGHQMGRSAAYEKIKDAFI